MGGNLCGAVSTPTRPASPATLPALRGGGTEPCSELLVKTEETDVIGVGAMANEIARKLRKTMTPQEVRLWSRLRGLKGQGYHFRRQVPVEGFIVDFACYRSRLIIEVDGGQHAETGHAARDAERDAKLSAEGFRVLRVWNSDVNDDIDTVMEAIVAALGH